MRHIYLERLEWVICVIDKRFYNFETSRISMDVNWFVLQFVILFITILSSDVELAQILVENHVKQYENW